MHLKFLYNYKKNVQLIHYNRKKSYLYSNNFDIFTNTKIKKRIRYVSGFKTIKH